MSVVEQYGRRLGNVNLSGVAAENKLERLSEIPHEVDEAHTKLFLLIEVLLTRVCWAF